MIKKSSLPKRKRLAALFASFAILSVGSVSLLESMAIDYYSVVNTIQKLIPAVLILGSIGWIMGMILDMPRKKKTGVLGDVNMYINDGILDDNSDDTAISADFSDISEDIQE